MIKKVEPKKIETKLEIIDSSNEKFVGLFVGQNVLAEENNVSRELYDKSRFGEVNEKGRFQYALIEALYLIERERLDVYEKDKKMKVNEFIKKARKFEPNFWTRYCVYRDLRKRGYIVKTALKFGADFRVYDRGVKPGDEHAKWIVYPVHESETMTWYEFAAKNRVAHSTKKRLLLGIADEESDVTYYEVNWVRP
ncbi:MAG: tRNA-intron lyase [Candidatus Nanoarchaeia archaeon]